ncbi:hypothetical protein F4779DRAFT_581468 [Xylariaceae sp. FL0662B]|nr:hypothetical protein F4779DRAFT_581468 [Xylariaceae sp. FL0662B]
MHARLSNLSSSPRVAAIGAAAVAIPGAHIVYIHYFVSSMHHVCMLVCAYLYSSTYLLLHISRITPYRHRRPRALIVVAVVYYRPAGRPACFELARMYALS